MLMEGLMPYGGYTPVIAAVWDTHAAGSMGRIGSPVELNIGYAVRIGDIIHLPKQTALRVFAGIHLIGIKRKMEQERQTLTPGQSEAAPRVRVPALGDSQSNGPDNKHRDKE